MSKAFREVFKQDVNDTFLSEESEFTTWREFSFIAQAKTYNVKKLLIIWNHDILHTLSPTVMYGQLLVGDALFLTKKEDWPIRPRKGQVIWTPRDTPWEILNCQEILRVLFRITLQAKESTQ